MVSIFSLMKTTLKGGGVSEGGVGDEGGKGAHIN